MFGKNKQAAGHVSTDSPSPVSNDALARTPAKPSPVAIPSSATRTVAQAIPHPAKVQSGQTHHRGTEAVRKVSTTQSLESGRASMPSAAAAAAFASNNPQESSEATPGARHMTVGRQIAISGEITHCGKLMVDGCVDAKLTDSETLQISETGLFRGQAVIKQAEIAGRFEGDLTVTDLLIVRSTGRIVGEIRYGELEIDRGGKLFGLIETVEPLPGMTPLELASDETADEKALAKDEHQAEEETPIKVAQSA